MFQEATNSIVLPQGVDKLRTPAHQDGESHAGVWFSLTFCTGLGIGLVSWSAEAIKVGSCSHAGSALDRQYFIWPELPPQ